ncbi:MAG TPA: hypothetical protein VGL61_29695 [Kofleriaceae bacterium]
MRRLAIPFVLASLGGIAAADDGSLVSTSLDASACVGPIPNDGTIERLDASAGATLWHRLHVGAGAGVGTGTTTTYLVEGFAEVGLWLHASKQIELLLGWRLGGARFSIHHAPTDAVMAQALIELRFHLRRRIDLTVQPFALTGYYGGLWAIMAGPSIGIAVPW